MAASKKTKADSVGADRMGATNVAKAAGQIDTLPPGYTELLADIKTRIAEARVRAALAVNRELVELYWHIGRLIVERQQVEGWGAGVIEHLATDIQKSFPGISGFSPGNVWRMRAFYLAYQQDFMNLAQPARESPQSLAQPARELQPELADASDGRAMPPLLSQIPWFHNVVLLEKIKDPGQRLWYALQTVQHGWSRAVLVHQIELDLYARQGHAQTNFSRTLPAPQSDLAHQILKDPYTFDFLALADDVRERQLEQGLLDHIRKFLLELGTGFAFVGSQFPLTIGGEDFYVDLLFYHLKLRSFVVIELKVEAFQVEFSAKMNLYLSAIDDHFRHSSDAPSIGLILCKDRNRVIVEYALRDSSKPLGVATYQLLPDNLKASLPTPEQLEAELQSESDEPK